MSKHRSLLTTVHGMGHISAVVTVGITNTPHTSQTSAKTLVRLRVNLATEHLQTQLGGQVRALLAGEVGDESVPVDGVTLGEVQAEDVILATLVILVLLAVLDTLDAGDGAVVQTDVVRLDDLLPVWVAVGQLLFLGFGLRAVQEGDDVAVQGAVDLKHAANDVLEAAQDTKRLVAVLVAIAPGAPVHTLTPGLLKTRSVGKDVAETGTQDDLAGGVLLAVRIGGFEEVLDGLDGGNGLVDDGRCVVLQDLLAGSVAEVGGDGTWISLARMFKL